MKLEDLFILESTLNKTEEIDIERGRKTISGKRVMFKKRGARSIDKVHTGYFQNNEYHHRTYNENEVRGMEFSEISVPVSKKEGYKSVIRLVPLKKSRRRVKRLADMQDGVEDTRTKVVVQTVNNCYFEIRKEDIPILIESLKEYIIDEKSKKDKTRKERRKGNL